MANDFNGDGQHDLAVSCNDSNRLAVRFADGTGRFYSKSPADLRDYATAGSSSCIATADLDGINGPDLALSLHRTSLIHVFLNDGAGQFSSAGAVPVGNGPLGIASADMNQTSW